MSLRRASKNVLLTNTRDSTTDFWSCDMFSLSQQSHGHWQAVECVSYTPLFKISTMWHFSAIQSQPLICFSLCATFLLLWHQNPSPRRGANRLVKGTSRRQSSNSPTQVISMQMSVSLVSRPWRTYMYIGRLQHIINRSNLPPPSNPTYTLPLRPIRFLMCHCALLPPGVFATRSKGNKCYQRVTSATGRRVNTMLEA